MHGVWPSKHQRFEVRGVDYVQFHASLNGLSGSKNSAVHLQSGILLCLLPVLDSPLERVAVIQLRGNVQWALLGSQGILQCWGVFCCITERGGADGCLLVVFWNNSQRLFVSDDRKSLIGGVTYHCRWLIC